MRQRQFLDVVSPEDAHARWRAALSLRPCTAERVPLAQALGRVVAAPVLATGDVPAFDRANMDGFAVRAEDLFGAEEHAPVQLLVRAPAIGAGPQAVASIEAGEARPIATGAPVPRGADAIVPIEDTEPCEGGVLVRRAVAPGNAISSAGSDVAQGEQILRAGVRLTARETGVLAACGIATVPCHRRVRVGVLSTGDEVVPPGEAIPHGAIHDANMTLLCDALQELGAEALPLGIAPDDRAALEGLLDEALARCDALLLSGGTSKGAGDLSYEVLADRCEIVVHGVALKPGKPICLAHHEGKPVVALPGFPTSAIFTFHTFVAPVLLQLSGGRSLPTPRSSARLLHHVRSERGRMDFQLVSLLPGRGEQIAVPLGRGSGSVTTFARADGFFALAADEEYAEAGELVEVTWLGRDLEPAALTIVGSHCMGLDLVLDRVASDAWPLRVLAVGSKSGLHAASQGATDVAPIHLYDAPSMSWNRPFLPPRTSLVRGYIRTQGIAVRAEDAERFGTAAGDAEAWLAAALASPLRIANRNPGSGTRVLLDAWREERGLTEQRPAGWSTSYRTHTAVAAAVAQGRADYGICLEQAAAAQQLAFIPWRDEHYDFVVPDERRDGAGVQAFIEALASPEVTAALEAAGFRR